MKPKPDVTLIGPGSLGASLLKALARSGYNIVSVISRKPVDEFRASGMTGTEIIRLNELSGHNLGKLIFVTTPDDIISGIAESLSGMDVNWRHRMVIHCSGFLTSDELSSLKNKGAGIASFHPLQTFTKKSDHTEFNGINISLEGDSGAINLLKDVVSDLGAKALLLDRKQKSMLHISAVFMSNYLVSLGAIADRLIRETIPERDVSLLSPLLMQTAANLAKNRPSDVLTGPVARGDIDTVLKHLEMLKGHDEIRRSYKMLGVETVRLAEQKGNLSDDTVNELKKILEEG